MRTHIFLKGLSANTKFFFLLLLVIVGLAACDQNKIFESNVNIPADGWSRFEHARFEVEITDTISPCNIYINVRNNSRYRHMELWLFVDVHTPSGIVERDTMEILLADHRGKWLGNGLGDKFDTRMVFRRNIRFPESGNYVFEYEQANREEPLIGIEDIGLRIEKIKNL